MSSNPLIQRYRYSTMRPKQFWVYVTLYVCIVLLIVSLNYSGYKYQTFFESITEFYRSLYYQFLTFQIMILFIWGAYNSGSAIKEEILNKSFDFFRMLPLSARKKAFGILIGKNLAVLLFGAINFMLLICFGMLSRINMYLQGQVIFVIISITILANSTSLLSSIRPDRKGKNSNTIFILLTVFFLMPMMINGIVALSSFKELERHSVYFFEMKIPILLLISFIALYFSCWVFKGIFRKFTYEQEPLFTRKGAVLFLLGYIFIAAGLYYTHIPQVEAELIYSYWFVTIIPILIIPVCSLRNLDKYIEYSRFIQGRYGPENTSIIPVLMYSNPLLAVVLFVIWAASSVTVSIFAECSNVSVILDLYHVLILFTSYLFLVLLLELYVLYKSVSNKIGLLLSFVLALYTILPLILSAIFDHDKIRLFSPFGFFVSILDGYGCSLMAGTSILLVNIGFCLFPALLIWNYYNYILTQRQEM